MLAVQTIHITWTKTSRGGKLAALRNRIPKQFPLVIPEEFPAVVWQKISFSERDQFATPSQQVTPFASNERFGCHNAIVVSDGDSAVLTYRYQQGAPAPRFFDKTGTCVSPEHSIRIGPNQWASVEYNGRFSDVDTGNWWYEQMVVNVAFGDAIDPQIFIACEPIECYSRLAHLW